MSSVVVPGCLGDSEESAVDWLLIGQYVFRRPFFPEIQEIQEMEEIESRYLGT